MFVLVILLPFLVNAQFNEKEFKFTSVDSVKGSKEELFVKSKTWLTKTFNSAKSVIQVEDKEAGRIIAQGVMKTPHQNMIGYGGTDNANFTLTIDCKDGKYRCVLSDFSHPYGGSYTNKKPATIMINKSGWNHIKEYTKQKSEEIISSLNEFMRQANDDF